MTSSNIVSLNRYRAHKAIRRLQMLPAPLRTTQRARPALEAMVAYAWEPAAGQRAAEPARISQRLEEFVPPSASGPGQWTLVSWLYHNLVPEAWETPRLLRPLLDDCLRSG